MREDDRVVEEPSLFVQARYLAAVPESGVYGHRALLAHRGLQQQLAEVLAEHLDGFGIRLRLGFTYHFGGDGGLEQALERVCHGLLDLLGKGASGVALGLTEVVIHLVAAFFGIGVQPDGKETFLLRAEDGEQVMRRHPVQRHLEVEIIAVFGGVGIAFGGLGGLGLQAADLEDGPEVAPYGLGLAEPFCDDIAGAGEGLRGVFSARLASQGRGALDIGPGACEGIPGPEFPHQVCQRFKPKFAGGRGPGAALGLPRQVDVFQFHRIHTILYPGPQAFIQCAGLFYRLEYGGLARFHLGIDIHPMLDFGHCRIVHTASLFLAVTADEGDGVPLGKHIRTVFHLPHFCADGGGDGFQVYLFHFEALNLRKRSLSTPQKASPKMPPDIFDVPSLRLTKITGTSAMWKPSLKVVYFISIWKP